MSEPRFKVGDRVRVTATDRRSPKGRTGTVKELSNCPWIYFDDYNPRAHPVDGPDLGIPAGHKDCIHQDFLEPITNDTMTDELKVTKAAVLEAASKCSTVKATLQVLFPEAFKPSDEPFEFGNTTWTTVREFGHGPLMVACSSAHDNLKYKSLLVCPGWEMRQQEHGDRTILTFHRKP